MKAGESRESKAKQRKAGESRGKHRKSGKAE